MSKDGNKIVLIALGLACFILLYSTVAFYVMEESEKGKKNVLQKKFDDITAARQELEGKLKDIEMVNVELKTRLGAQEETISNLTAKLEDEKKENKRNSVKLQARGSEIRGMKAKIDANKMEKDDLLKKLDQLKADAANLAAKIKELTVAKEDVDKKTAATSQKEGVSLGTIVVNQRPAGK